MQGYALNCTVASEAMPKKIVGAKIACLDFSLQKAKMKMGVQVFYNLIEKLSVYHLYIHLLQVLINDPEKLDSVRAREFDITKERIQKILSTGVNVVLCSGGIFFELHV